MTFISKQIENISRGGQESYLERAAQEAQKAAENSNDGKHYHSRVRTFAYTNLHTVGEMRDIFAMYALRGLPRPPREAKPEDNAAWLRGRMARQVLIGTAAEVDEVATIVFANGVAEVEEFTGEPYDAWVSRCLVAEQVVESRDYPSEGSFAFQLDELLYRSTGVPLFPDKVDCGDFLFDDEEEVESGDGGHDATKSVVPKRFQSLAELRGMPVEPRAGVMPPYLMRGQVSLLVASPGSGKSLYCAAAAIALAAGRPWDGGVAPEPMPVIIVNNEDDMAENIRRLKAAMVAAKVNPDLVAPLIHLADTSEPFILVQRSAQGVERGKDLDVLEKQIEATGAGLVVIDPAIEVMQVSENDNVEMKEAFGVLRGIARKYNCAVLVVHHAGKEGARGLNAARGASSIAGVVRGYRTMSDVDEKGLREMQVPPDLAADLVRVDDVKMSYGARRRLPSYFMRVAFTIDGEEVAALVEYLVPGDDE